MNKKLTTAILSLTLTTTLLAAENGASLYKKCAGCHGTKGEKAALGKSKIIKDFKKGQFISALKGYKAGTYGGAQKVVMQGQVKNLSDAQISAIASFIAK